MTTENQDKDYPTPIRVRFIPQDEPHTCGIPNYPVTQKEEEQREQRLETQMSSMFPMGAKTYGHVKMTDEQGKEHLVRMSTGMYNRVLEAAEVCKAKGGESKSNTEATHD